MLTRASKYLLSKEGKHIFEKFGYATSVIHAATEDQKAIRNKVKVSDIFGYNSFSRKAQREYLPPKIYKEITQCVNKHKPVSPRLADAFAQGLLQWAEERGATHFTHWFTPLTNKSASKHDAFVKRAGDHVISSFSGKTLSFAEPDGSSFPSGGLRETHEARGYSIWDPSSPPFLIDHGSGSTLYVPASFISWCGDPLDEKTPLLRSVEALNENGMRLLELVGEKGHTHVHADSGIEQEFFLVDANLASRRPDVLQTGRTLFGAAPPKGQQLSDHYFTDLSERAMHLINDSELDLWKLGIPQTTRHKEVSPGQYEIAPQFSPVSVASDQNLLTMEVLKRTAHKHGMEILFHEKPFKGLNGSGKHNNWSIGSNKQGTFFEPGEIPQKNLVFITMITAVIRAVDVHSDLLRIAVANAANDHRMGAQEAPPAIISVYLGEDIVTALEKFSKGDFSKTDFGTDVDLGFSCVPRFSRDPTDRNRTSPFAFTGNKFEFRAVGSSQLVHRSNYILNSIVAQSMANIADQIEQRLPSRGVTKKVRQDIVEEVLRENIEKHSRIIFNGDNYSQEWHQEAERRGLLNLKNTAEALDHLNSEKNVKLFSELNIFSEKALQSRTNVWREEYSTKLVVEADSLLNIVNQQILPAAIHTQSSLATSINSASDAGVDVSALQSDRLTEVSELIGELLQNSNVLKQDKNKVNEVECLKEKAKIASETITKSLEKTRESIDALELICDAELWTLPTYHDMILTGQEFISNRLLE